MFVRWLQQLPWQLTCALFAMIAMVNADIQASSTPPSTDFFGQIALLGNNGANLTGLIPMSRGAASQGDFAGTVFFITDSNFQNISTGDIALISCDPYSGNLQATNIFQSISQSNEVPVAAIFYSTANNYCNSTERQDFPMYSTTSAPGSEALLALHNQSTPLMARVQRNSSSGNGSGNASPNNPLGPSPSTAVAMIILYSITGIITALFLVIIVTGAIRAHRHPDRYGPRDVLGRPRQSRARGLGRAILDTLPIVKFGEKEPPKPTDVELGSTSETRAVDADGTAVTTAGAEQEATTGSTEARDATATETTASSTTDTVLPTTNAPHVMEEGIAPAQPTAAGAPVILTDASPDEGLGCSICTDDFEKGQDLRVLPCNHKFHPECVDPWLLNVSGTCPLCRVDLRPVTSNTSTEGAANSDPDHLAPPLQSDSDPAHRRRPGLHNILSFRSRPNASPQERISALRRLREQRDVEGTATGSNEEVANRRRSNRMSVRLSDVFSGRRRREESPHPAPAVAESSTASAVPAPIPSAGESENAVPVPVSHLH